MLEPQMRRWRAGYRAIRVRHRWRGLRGKSRCPPPQLSCSPFSLISFSCLETEDTRVGLSNRLHRNPSHILHQPDFLLKERLGIGNSRKHSVEPCHSFYPSADFGAGGEDVLAGFLVAKLRFVGHQRFEACFELIGDGHDKGWADVVIQRRVDDFEWAMRGEALSG